MLLRRAMMAGGSAPSGVTLLDMPFTSDMLDLTGKTVTNVGGCYIDPSDGAVGLGCMVAPAAAYLSVPVNAAFGADNFSIEMYLKFVSSSGSYVGCFGFEANAAQDHSLWVITNNALSTWISSSGTGWNVSSNMSIPGLTIGNWHHLKLTRAGTALKLDVDGSTSRSWTVPAGAFTQKGPTSFIGKKPDGLTANVVARFQHLKITKG